MENKLSNNKNTEKARVLLLNPPTAAVSTEILLSLAYLAASLRKAGHEVKIVDATAPRWPVSSEEIKKVVSAFQPHFIGVTLTIDYIPQTYLYLKDLHKMGVPIVAGGPHANCLPEEVLANGSDIVVIGEGEITVLELAEYFIGARALNSIDGLCYKCENEKCFYTSPRKLVKNLDDIPFPDFGDFPIKNYTGSDDVNSNPVFWSIFTSRGCPFDCIFCSSHNVFGRNTRLRSAHNVFEEIKSLVKKFGVEKIAFQDDEILCSKKIFMELCDLISDSGLKIKLSLRTRIDSIDKEIILKAKKAGLGRISFGIESWNDDTLTKINKKYNVKKIHEKLSAIEEAAFPYISFNNICGFPWETKDHLKKNLIEISKIGKSIEYFNTVVTPVPYPKTKLYEMYHEQYGFTEWWLDPARNSPVLTDRIKPFFMHFASQILTLYNTDTFWGYSRKMQRQIEHFSWEVFRLFLSRHLKFYDSALVLFLCKVSHLIWSISPALERLIFKHILSNPKILKLKDKTSFTSK